MNASKEFMQYIRKVMYKEVYLILNGNILPHLTLYVSMIEEIKFEDGFYHTYYGDLKQLLSSFLSHWKYVIDDIIIEADRLMHFVDKDELLLIMERTIDVHQVRHIEFGKGFLPIHSPLEKQAYEEIEELYKQYMPKLYELKAQIERFDKQEKVDNFAKSHFKLTIAKTTEVFQAAHTFLSMMVADRIYQIRVSLEEIWLRLCNNLRDIREKSEEELIGLLHELYEKNKELLLLARQDRRCSIENAEAGHAIEKIRAKIAQYSYEPPLSRLEDEVAYWDSRVKDFRKIAEMIVRLKKEQDEVIKQEQIYDSIKTSELPGSRKQCWLNMGENFVDRKKYLKERIIETGRSMMTFFAIRGHDRIFYNDEKGPYYIDEYNHQVFMFDYGMSAYHLNCEGVFREVSDEIPYYFDKFGRYTKDKNGDKTYQCAACTSQYKIGTGNLLLKISEDCGHSERLHQKCHMIIKDEIKFEILPNNKPVDVKRSLDPETVRYLWDSFGHALPFALRDVACDKTRNPIQYLAHKLLLHKYNKTKTEFSKKFKESQDYRVNIFKERKERAMEASRKWKSKQVKPRKPEESDDRDEREAREALAAQANIAQTMNLLTYD